MISHLDLYYAHLASRLHDDRISGLQVQTQTTSSRGQHEDLVRAVRVIELQQEILSIIRFGVSIKPTRNDSSILAVHFEEIDGRPPLEEDEDL